jgi:hypothetical protein
MTYSDNRIDVTPATLTFMEQGDSFVLLALNGTCVNDGVRPGFESVTIAMLKCRFVSRRHSIDFLAVLPRWRRVPKYLSGITLQTRHTARYQ